ncbi:hypothetical protein HW555_011645, partial [Spodoptera exigua]
ARPRRDRPTGHGNRSIRCGLRWSDAARDDPSEVGVSQGLISRTVKETHVAEEAATKIQTPAKERNVKINYTAQSEILRKLLYNMGLDNDDTDKSGIWPHSQDKVGRTST